MKNICLDINKETIEDGVLNTITITHNIFEKNFFWTQQFVLSIQII